MRKYEITFFDGYPRLPSNQHAYLIEAHYEGAALRAFFEEWPDAIGVSIREVTDGPQANWTNGHKPYGRRRTDT